MNIVEIADHIIWYYFKDIELQEVIKRLEYIEKWSQDKDNFKFWDEGTFSDVVESYPQLKGKAASTENMATLHYVLSSYDMQTLKEYLFEK